MVGDILTALLLATGAGLMAYPALIEPALRNRRWRKWERSNSKPSDSGSSS